MRAIKVATDDGNIYYGVVSRLKKTHLRFSSVSPGEVVGHTDDLIITGRSEVSGFGGEVVAAEDLDQDPLIMEGQLLSRLLEGSRRNLVAGVDPGASIGIAVFYGGRELGASTTNSEETAARLLAQVAEKVPHTSLAVKIGNGEPRSSLRLATLLREGLPREAVVEMVDESGTSLGPRRGRGETRDQRAAARIAFRKGVPFKGELRPRRTRE